MLQVYTTQGQHWCSPRSKPSKEHQQACTVYLCTSPRCCRHEALPFVAEGRTWSSDMITVSKPVYASTTITAVNIDSSRADASNPEPCYPDICFAVDNFDKAFDDLVSSSLHQRCRWMLFAEYQHLLCSCSVGMICAGYDGHGRGCVLCSM